MEIELTISKKAVIEEVAQTTSYTGAKMEGDTGAFDRISTVDEDEQQLERFWKEGRAELCRELIGLVAWEGEGAEQTYELRLDVSGAFDTALLPSMRVNLTSYFVLWITALWYVYTNKKEAAEYEARAKAALDDLHRKAMYKKKPVRPKYD